MTVANLNYTNSQTASTSFLMVLRSVRFSVDPKITICSTKTLSDRILST
jgi:hypothetical protein